MLGAIYREVSCSFFVSIRKKIIRKRHFILSMQIDCTDKIYLCHVILKMYAYGIT